MLHCASTEICNRVVGHRGSEHFISHGHVVEANRKQFVGHPSHDPFPSVARGAHVMVISLLVGCGLINVVSEVGATPPSAAPASVMAPGDGELGLPADLDLYFRKDFLPRCLSQRSCQFSMDQDFINGSMLSPIGY